jgi:hypothetical protein
MLWRNAFTRHAAETAAMSRLGLTSPISTGIASSALGSTSAGAAERSAKLDNGNHSLAVGQKALASHPLDRDANTSADRDADGWTGDGSATPEEAQEQAETQAALDQSNAPTRLRLPGDPRGGSLDVRV